MVRKNTKWIYLISTGLVALISIVSGVINISVNETVRELAAAHGFNILIGPFFGTVKILGAITIITPALRRFHEAAYSGFVFYFIGATYFNIIDGSPSYTTTIAILVLVIVSYLSYRKIHPLKKDGRIKIAGGLNV